MDQVIDMTPKKVGSEFGSDPNSDFPVWMDQPAVIERYRSAILRAGGNQVVARISGVPKGTINNLLRGTDVRVSNAYAIAAACHVSLDWLATGIGPETPEWYVPGPTTGSALVPLGSPPAAPDARRPLESQSRSQPAMREPQQPVSAPTPIDSATLRKAIEIIKSIDGIEAFEADSIADRVAAAYDVLTGAKP